MLSRDMLVEKMFFAVGNHLLLKLLLLQTLGYLKDKTALPSVCCIVVSPLVSLMRTQEKKMHSQGIRSLYLSEEDLSLREIEKGLYFMISCCPAQRLFWASTEIQLLHWQRRIYLGQYL